MFYFKWEKCLLVLFVIFGIYLFLRLALWIISCYLSWFLAKHYETKLRIGKVNLFSLREVFIQVKNGTTVEIESMWFSSSILHSSYRSVLVLCISDIRLQGDVDWMNSSTSYKAQNVKKKSHSLKLPNKILNLLKVFSLHVFNISVNHLGTPGQDCLLHTTLNELSLCFSSKPSKLELCASIVSVSVKIFKHMPQNQPRTDSCLAHLTVSFVVHVCLSSTGSPFVQNVNIIIMQPELMLYDGFQINKLKGLLSTNQQLTSEIDDPQVKIMDDLPVCQLQEVEEPNKLTNLLLNLPESAQLKVESSSVKLMRESGHRAFTTDIKLVEVDFKQDLSKRNSISSQFVVKDLLVASSVKQFVALTRISMKCQMINNGIEISVQTSSFHLSYQREELQYWLGLLPSNFTEEDKCNEKLQASSPLNHKAIFNHFRGFSLQATVELEDVSIAAKLPGCSPFSVGLTHSKLTADCHSSVCGYGDSASYHFAFFRDTSLELLLETVWFQLGEGNIVDNGTLKRHHFWKMPLSVGVLLLKVQDFPSDLRIQCMLDSIQLEWSPCFAALIHELSHFSTSCTVSSQPTLLSLTNINNSNAPISNLETSKKPPLFFKSSFSEITSLMVKCNATGVNVFAFSETGTGIILRIDSLITDSSTDKILLSIEECKVASLVQVGQTYPCIKSSEIKSSVLYLRTIHFSYKLDDKEMNLNLLDQVHSNWNSTFHLTILNIVQEISAIWKLRNQSNQEEVKSSLLKTTCLHALFKCRAHGDISLGATLSKSHRMAFLAEELNINIQYQRISAQTGQLIISFDDHPVFTFQQLSVSSSQDAEEHLVKRHIFSGLQQKYNKSWYINMEEWKTLFPYKYNFAEAFTEEAIGIIKWLKVVHRKRKVPFTVDSPLPSDFCIKIKTFSLEIGDDPFEVKLRDNYELLDDEYHESLKRKKMLDEKCEKLRCKLLLLPTEKLDELYATLSKKNADIYVQRSRQLYHSTPRRTSLVTWHLEDVEILYVADPSYHGTERVINIMQEIDMESPYPEEGLEFTTLWCRMVQSSIQSLTCNLRDFPQALLEVRELHVWGRLIGAEQEATQRAKRYSLVEIGDPWGNATVERSMTSLKYYHDLSFDMESMCIAYGPCWEPVLTQMSLSMDSISRPSLDPSPALPWWDKMRLLYHGRLTLSVQHLILLMHASLDPYNITEQVEIMWSNVIIDWTNAKVVTKGDLDIYVHTASKYDDCRLLHIPNLKLSAKMDWLCLGNPNDHHSIMPCAPDKIPEYSSNQVHDSYRAFRSQNVKLSLSLETKPAALETAADIPTMLLYSSTLRWIENLKMIFSGVTRLTRRGNLFHNTKPRKPQLSRHYRSIRLALNLHKFQICYWMSFAKQRGLELLGGRLSLSSEHSLLLVPIEDGLKHRPRAVWSIEYMNCELCDSEIWLYNCARQNKAQETEQQDYLENKSLLAPVERSYFLSVNRVSYGREALLKDVVPHEDEEDTPLHRLVVHGLKGAWTKNNREVMFSLFDSYMKAKLLKRNLSTEALKVFKMETQNMHTRVRCQTSSNLLVQNPPTSTLSPMNRLQSGHAASMLQQLIAESEADPMVYTEEIEGSTREQQLHGVAACQTDDVLHKNWLIELVNSQVMLKGCETSGYVIVSAAKAQILQRIHCPVWKDRTLVSKTTWVGSLECMQYYATVDAGEPGPSVDIMWLSLDNIEERESMVISDLPDLVGSGHSVGGVVSSTVGAASDPTSAPLQLQRIVSRCGCQFFYASYGENVDRNSLEEVPPLPEDDDLWEKEVAVDSFTLTHHDLDICTNSLQYAMILDLVNNLLLYVEPRKKEASEKLQRMRFHRQLCSINDQRGPILQLQEHVRSLVSNFRRLEKEAYLVHKSLCENPDCENYIMQLEELENEMYECKEQLNSGNEELSMMISCFKETQISATKTRQRASSQEKGVTVVRRSEVCFKHAQWRLTDADGQLGIADLVLSNFLYSKVTKSDNSVEHLLELGYVKVTNLLPNQSYKDVLQPTELQSNIPLDRQRALRIFCRERAPVGGISVKEHLEVNVIPITIGMTNAFFKTMLQFFFPGRHAVEKTEEHHAEEEQQFGSTPRTKKRTTLAHQRGCTSSHIVGRNDIEKMKERADKNHTFLYVKIPEVPLRVSYKGEKEKNIEDVHDLSLVLSTLEYHNKTWTWLDLLMEMKNDTKRALLSQAIKQKILKSSRTAKEEDTYPQEEDKARLLLGFMGAPEKTIKRSLFSRSQK